jgi:hypothetical protein
MTTDQLFTWAVLLAVAVALDALLLRWLRARFRQRGVNVLVERTDHLGMALGSLVDGVRNRLPSGARLSAALNRRLLPAHPASAPNGASARVLSPASHDARLQATADQPAPVSHAAVLAAEAPGLGPDPQPAPGSAPVPPETQGAAAPPPAGPEPQSQAPAPAEVLPSPASLVPAAPVQVTQSMTTGVDPWARVNIQVEMPVGATMRLTIETAPNSAPSVTVASQALADPPGPATRVQPALAQGMTSPPAVTRPGPSRLSTPRVRVWPAGSAALAAGWARARAAARTHDLATWLFGFSLAVYLLTRLIGLSNFPIYFFSDEAIQTVLAANFVRDGFRNFLGEVFPTYFQNGPFWNLSVSVYAQVLPYLLFGKSILVNRGTSVLITVAGAAAVGLILKRCFHARHWWAGVLLLSIAPAWFLHSRTAFETAEMVALYACFLYFYLRYRCDDPRYLYAALVFGALSFYAYSPGQMVMVVTGALLLIADLRYHLQHRRVGLMGLALVVVLALPLVRFRLSHPDAAYAQLRERGSYLVDPNVPVREKVTRTLDEYLYGLSPAYWYVPNSRDMLRHVMKGQGNLPTWTLPLAVLGLWLIARSIRSPAHRVVLLALLAAPTGGALAEIGITRVLMFVIPATLVAALGLMEVLAWAEQHGVPPRGLAVGTFVVLAGLNVALLREALVNAPTWYDDYGLGGMQWGVKQLFTDRLPAHLARDPNERLVVSPAWANGTDVFSQFFFSEDQQARVSFASIDYFTSERRVLDPHLVLVLPADEYQRALADPKLTDLTVDELLRYPDGSPGFYFVRLAYSAQADALFAADAAAQRQPVTETVTLDGQAVVVVHSALGAGQLSDMLDGDTFTLGRGLNANPLVVDFTFSAPRAIGKLVLTLGSMDDFTVKLEVYAAGGAEPQVVEQDFTGLSPDPTVELALGPGTGPVQRALLSIRNNLTGDEAAIHIREIDFQP